MSTITPATKLFNLSFLEALDDKDFVAEAIALYLHDTHVDLGEMQKAYADGDIRSVWNTAHKLKSSTGMLQANILLHILAQVEHIAIQGEKNSELEGLLQIAQYEFNKLQAALELYMR